VVRPRSGAGAEPCRNGVGASPVPRRSGGPSARNGGDRALSPGTKPRRCWFFAAAVDREDVTRGAEELGGEHDTFVVAALEPDAEELGLAGEPA
jgi:hypothetical protein